MNNPLTPREARYKAALEEIREVARLMHGRGKGLVKLVDKALDESTVAP